VLACDDVESYQFAMGTVQSESRVYTRGAIEPRPMVAVCKYVMVPSRATVGHST
jgi:hypothetical protein